MKKILFVIFVTFLVGTHLEVHSLQQTNGMSTVCRNMPKFVAGLVAGALAMKTVQTAYLLNICFDLESKGIFEYKKKQEKYLAPEHVQKKARRIYEDLCARKRKRYDFKGKVNDWLVKKFGLINVYQGDPDTHNVFENKSCGAYVCETGIHFPEKSFTTNASIDATNRANLYHEVIHLYRGDYLCGTMWFLKHIEKLFKKFKIYEFETEKETVLSLHKARDYEALLWRFETNTADFQKYPHECSSQTLGAFAGYAKIKKDPEFAKKLKAYLDEKWNHSKDCDCRECLILELCKNWKPKGFLRSRLWHRRFLKKCKVGLGNAC